MFREEFSNVISAGRGKIDLLNNSKGRYLVYAMLAGLYVSFGIMLAFTIGGILDSANVEIAERVKDDNIVIFGLKDNEVNDLRQHGQYNAWDYYNNDPRIKRVVDSLVDGTFHESREEFRMIFDELMNRNDEYFLFADFESYLDAQAKIDALYRDRATWSKMCLVNIAQSGYFSSDRTIEEYVADIWKLDRVKR